MEFQRKMLGVNTTYPSACDLNMEDYSSKAAESTAGTCDWWEEESPKLKRLGLAAKRKHEDSDDMSDDELPEGMKS